MHYGDTSSTKILQELEKYCQIKADIRYQAKTSQITKEKQEELLEDGKKEGKEIFFTKNCRCFWYQGCQ